MCWKIIIFGENDVLRKNAYFFICMHVGCIKCILFLRIIWVILTCGTMFGNADFDADVEEEGEPEETAPPEE